LQTTLAGGIDAGEYEERSTERNIAVVQWRVEVDAQDPTVLLPSFPLLSYSRTVTFRNQEPMELGCRYGFSFWDKSESEAESNEQLEKKEEGEQGGGVGGAGNREEPDQGQGGQTDKLRGKFWGGPWFY